MDPSLIFNEAEQRAQAGAPPIERVLNTTFEWDRGPARHPCVVIEEVLSLFIELLDMFADVIEDGTVWQTIRNSPEYNFIVETTAELRTVELAQLTNNDQRVCFLLNLYHALVIHTVITGNPPTSILERYSFFKEYYYEVGELGLVNLEELEYGLIRSEMSKPATFGASLLPQFGKKNPKAKFAIKERMPLLNFALSTGAESSPPIYIYSEYNLQHVLRRATRSFLSANVQIDPAKRKITLPKLMELYKRDFGDDPVAFIEKYLPQRQQAQLRNMWDAKGQKWMATLKYAPFEWTMFTSLRAATLPDEELSEKSWDGVYIVPFATSNTMPCQQSDRLWLDAFSQLPSASKVAIVGTHISNMISDTVHPFGGACVRFAAALHTEWEARHDVGDVVRRTKGFSATITNALMMTFPPLRSELMTSLIAETVMDAVLPLAYPCIMHAFQEKTADEDGQLLNKISHVRLLSDLSTSIHLEPRVVHALTEEHPAVTALRRLSKGHSLQAKLEALAECDAAITRTLEYEEAMQKATHRNSTVKPVRRVGGDQHLGAFTLVIVRATVPHLHAECQFLYGFMSDEMLVDQAASPLFSLRAAMQNLTLIHDDTKAAK